MALLNQLSEKDSIIESKDQELQFRQAKIDKLTHEIAVLRRLKFAASSERLANEQQASLLDEAIDADLAAIEAELEALRQRGSPNAQADAPRTPRRTALPTHLPRTVLRHEPDSTQCGCGAALERMGEDVSERLDYTPGVFSVERHARQVGLPLLPNPGAGACARPRDRQRAAHHRLAGRCAGGQVRRASAAVPPRVHLCPRRRTHCTLDAVGPVGQCGVALQPWWTP